MLFKTELLGHVDDTNELILKTNQILAYIQSQITKKPKHAGRVHGRCGKLATSRRVAFSVIVYNLHSKGIRSMGDRMRLQRRNKRLLHALGHLLPMEVLGQTRRTFSICTPFTLYQESRDSLMDREGLSKIKAGGGRKARNEIALRKINSFAYHGRAANASACPAPRE